MKKKILLGVIICIAVIGGYFVFSGKDADKAGVVGEEIIFCQGNDLTTMDNNVGIQERACALTNNMFDSLLTFDSEMKLVPCLAESYEWIDDKTLEMKVRSGVKFHDGSVMTPEDVAFTMDRINEKGSLFGNLYHGTEIIDGNTIRIKLNSPNPSFPNLLAVPYAGIVPKKVVDADPDNFGKNPVGTGPYKLKDFKEGDYYTLERFDECWNGPAKTKLLTMKIVPETSQRIMMLETGDVNVAYDVPPSSIQRIKHDKNLQLLTCGTMKVYMINFNCKSNGPLKNVKVRKAIAAAINKEEIVDKLLHGYGTVATSMIPPKAKEYENQPIADYSPDEAKKLLKEAGYADGCKLQLITDGNQTSTECAQIIQDQLSKIGIELELKVQDLNTTFSMLQSGQDFDMIMDFFNLVAGHADLVYKRVLYSDSKSNWCNYKNPDYDACYNSYTSAPEGPERDNLRKKANEYFINDVPVLPLWVEEKVIGAQANIKGIKLSPIGSHEYQNAEIVVTE